VGALALTFDAMDLPGDEAMGLTLTAYTAEPGSPTADALTLLANWAATIHDGTNPTNTDQHTR